MGNGLFIVVEGIDTSGITTHSKFLVSRLKEMGFKALYTKEPTEGPIGKIIREFLRSKHPDPRLLALLFAADRIWHCFKDPTLPGGGILGALRKNYIVVSDRYLYSSLAYQGKDVGMDWVMNINKWALVPDVVIYLKIDVKTALRRLKEREIKDFYEAKSELEKILEMFDKIIDRFMQLNVSTNLIVVNEIEDSKELGIEETNREIIKKLSKFFGELAY